MLLTKSLWHINLVERVTVMTKDFENESLENLAKVISNRKNTRYRILRDTADIHIDCDKTEIPPSGISQGQDLDQLLEEVNRANLKERWEGFAAAVYGRKGKILYSSILDNRQQVIAFILMSKGACCL